MSKGLKVTLVLLALVAVIAVVTFIRATANPQRVDDCNLTKKQERAGLGCQ